MIVNRQVFTVKPGCTNETIKLLQDMWKWLDLPVTHRIYRPITGQYERVIQEIEFEDYDARAKFWADVWSRPGAAAMGEKFSELRGPSHTNEFLEPIE